jgi:hypothetical protein
MLRRRGIRFSELTSREPWFPALQTSKDTTVQSASTVRDKHPELFEYLVVFVYLALFLGMFSTYRFLLMREYELGMTGWGFAVGKALVLAHLVVTGEKRRLGKRDGDRPLIVPTIYRAFIFCLLEAVLETAVHILVALLHHKGVGTVFSDLVGPARDETIARALVVFFSFVPLFAVFELQDAMPNVNLFDLLFRRRTRPTEPAG